MTTAESYILMCPCCNSTIDAERETLEDGTPKIQTFECSGCGQQFEMIIDPARFAAYSMA